jgi:hypothetical protein
MICEGDEGSRGGLGWSGVGWWYGLSLGKSMRKGMRLRLSLSLCKRMRDTLGSAETRPREDIDDPILEETQPYWLTLIPFPAQDITRNRKYTTYPILYPQKSSRTLISQVLPSFPSETHTHIYIHTHTQQHLPRLPKTDLSPTPAGPSPQERTQKAAYIA